MTPPAQLTALKATLLSTATVVVTVLPVFLVGALAVQLSEDLAFGLTGIGAAVAAFRTASAVCTLFVGRYVDHIGATWSIRLGMIISGGASLAIATTARSFTTLVLWLMIASCGNAFGQPAANRLLVNRVGTGRLGAAFGLKQSAPPIASMLGGLAVPLIAVTVGWRWAFALVASFAALVATGTWGRAPAGRRATGRRPRQRLEDRGLVVLMSVAFGLGNSASSSVPAFFVTSAIGSGMSAELAGSLLAVGSVAAIATRISAGAASDRRVTRHFELCTGLILCGSLGILMLAVGTPLLMWIGVILALAGAWGFHGVFWYALVRAYRGSPGAITGAVAPGGLVGGSVGPLVVGAVADVFGFTAAWAVAAASAVLGALTMYVGGRRMSRRATGPSA